MDSNKKDIFWLDQPLILYENYLYFIPTPQMTMNQKFNAITLFCIYALILLLLFNRNILLICLPIILIIIIILLHAVEKKYGKNNNSINPETFNDMEVGYYDSNGELRFNRTTSLPTKKADVTYSCRKPTVDNPFMNPPISDFNTEAPAPCNTDDENINNEINKAFKTDLYMDIDDVFSKKNSQRLFYTVPNASIPNNQEDFANWLYRAPVTCKEDQEQCLRYEDLRFKR